MDHHFVPKFLIRQWADATGEVQAYRRVRGRLTVQRAAPAATGYEIDLYAISSRPTKEARQEVELRLMQRIDSTGASLLREILETGQQPDDPKRGSDWARFLMSMMHRSPARMRRLSSLASRYQFEVTDLDDEYQKVRPPDGPATARDWVAANRVHIDDELAKGALAMAINSPRIGDLILSMHWGVVRHPSGPSRQFLLSDQPVVHANFKTDDAFLIMPIGPEAAFVAARKLDYVEAMRRNEVGFAEQVNNDIVRKAQTVVIASSRSQTRFIENRFFPAA